MELSYQNFLKVKFDASDEQVYTIDKYCQSIIKWSARHNLVSKNDLAHLINRHVIPSAYMANLVSQRSHHRIADVGSGAGFPGAIIKILLPSKSVCLIDSSRKKYLFLLELCESLGLACEVINTRIESMPEKSGGHFDAVVSRGVASLGSLWKWSAASISPAGSLFVLKGDRIDKEIEELSSVMDLDVSILKPGNEWQEIGTILKEKIVVTVRRKNDSG
jgi:16S rRNA (guanine527-N7)-methyltransferase